MADVVNRYSTIDLFIPDEHHARIGDFVSRSASDSKPFARQVDLWWLAIGTGVQTGYRTPMPDKEKLVKFNTGAILSTDPWRITQLELLALADEGDSVFEEPNRVMQVASEYAMTGFPWLIEQMLGEAEPTLALMNKLDEQLREV
jgi:hypothetical protein